MEDHDSPPQELLDELHSLRARVEQLTQDAARHRAVVSNLTATVVECDSNGCFTLISDQVRELMGIAPEDALGKSFVDWIHPDDLPRIMAHLGKIVAGEPRIDIRYRIRHADGHYVPVAASGRRVIVSEDYRLVAEIRDDSERVAGEDRLNRLFSAFEQSTDALAVSDLSGTVQEANDATLELFGAASVTDLIGKSGFDLVTESDADKAERDHKQLLAEGRLEDVRTHFRNHRGEEKRLSLNMSVIADATGAPTGIVTAVRDLTAREKLEDELIKARKLESIGLLAGGIAHDFNNVLSAILGNLNVARTRCDSASDLHPLLRDAEKATLRARRLTQQLLTFARGGEPVRTPVRVLTLLEDAIAMGLPEDAPRPRLALDSNLWSADVDPAQARHALEHLLRNGVAACGRDTPLVIRARNTQVGQNHGSLARGSYVQIDFEDSGPPIPPERRADVFDPYFKTKSPDTALALATAFSIANRHGGTITVDSGPEEGSVFTIFLPASLTPTQEHALQQTRIAGEGRRVLVMDDEQIVRRVARRMLESLGFVVTHTADGAEAIERYRHALHAREPFHAVMLDLTVPGGLGGRDTMAKLLEIDPDVRAIVASGYSDDALMAAFAEHGFRAVLAKPFQLAELAAALHRTL